MMGSPERWPGFLRLKQRLEFLAAAMKRDAAGHAFLAIDLAFERQGPISRVYTDGLQVSFPSSQQEFERIGYRIPLAFSPTVEQSKALLRELVAEDSRKHPLHRVAFWAYSGYSNVISCIYNAQTLNEGTTEVYIESLGDGKYAIGLEANGNLFDSLLISDELELPKERLFP